MAAEKGDAAGQYWLGNHYCDGKGVQMDFKEAVNWYLLAAEQSYAPAQASMGYMYDAGLGVP